MGKHDQDNTGDDGWSTDPDSLSLQLLAHVTASGALIPSWRDAFAAVPRHRFVPDTIWIEDGAAGAGLVPLRRAQDPQGWLRRAYDPGAVVTQVDGGHPAGPGPRGRCITSSADQPSVVALMLAALDARPGMQVCEIGTGTGYHAALLAHRLGIQNVTTIEVDPGLAERARRTLTTTGYPVTVITGDGAEGYPPHAPYDRIISTAAVQQVPYAWVAQTCPGGKILTPWHTAHHSGALLRLTVNSDGTAVGRIVGNVAATFLRSQCIDTNPNTDANAEKRDEVAARKSHPNVAPCSVADADRWLITITPKGQQVTHPEPAD